jgi:predicted nucleotidyltransferase
MRPRSNVRSKLPSVVSPMESNCAWPRSAPDAHRSFVSSAVSILREDPRIVGVAASGSWADDTMDAHSDIDLVIAVEPSAFDEVMSDRHRIASMLGQLLSSFSGEHVGEPRVLICLYDEPLLHVDLKFVDVDRIGATVDRPTVLWARGSSFASNLDRSFTGYPAPDDAWIEDRFWTWIHYGTEKVLRGELYEALDLIAFLRARVLGPLILRRVGEKPAGVRRLERAAPEWTARLQETVANHTPESCIRAIENSVKLYRELRSPEHPVSSAETAATTHLRKAEIAASLQ